MRGSDASAVTPSAAVRIGTRASLPVAAPRPGTRPRPPTAATLREGSTSRPPPRGAGERRAQRNEDAGAVSGHTIGGPRPTVADGGEACECPVEQLARRAPAQVGDEADPACAPFASRVVEEALPFVHRASRLRVGKDISRRLLLS